MFCHPYFQVSRLGEQYFLVTPISLCVQAQACNPIMICFACGPYTPSSQPSNDAQTFRTETGAGPIWLKYQKGPQE